MADALRFKPTEKRVRLIMTDGPGRAMSEHEGKVFCLIGRDLVVDVARHVSKGARPQ